VIMLILSASLFTGLFSKLKWARWSLQAIFVFGLLVTAEVIAGWVYANHVEISAITKWFLVSWIALWLTTLRASKR
jgi:hypothetical protein